jgi:hypothetical protein
MTSVGKDHTEVRFTEGIEVVQRAVQAAQSGEGSSMVKYAGHRARIEKKEYWL